MLRSIKSSVSLKNAKLPFKKVKERGKTTAVDANDLLEETPSVVVDPLSKKENACGNKRALSSPPGSPHKIKKLRHEACNR